MIFVLDTNVLSALIAAEFPPAVGGWVAAREKPTLFTTTVCQAEILSGLVVMPPGRRRSALLQAAQTMFLRRFEGRVLGFDVAAAIAYADIHGLRRSAGHPLSMADTMIAAIARVHNATVVTRNVRDFDGCGVEVVNPWDAPVT